MTALMSTVIEIWAIMRRQAPTIPTNLRHYRNGPVMCQVFALMSLWSMRLCLHPENHPTILKCLVQCRLMIVSHLSHHHISTIYMKDGRFLEEIQCCRHSHRDSRELNLRPILPRMHMIHPHQCRRNLTVESLQDRGVSIPPEESRSMLDHVKTMLSVSRVVASNLRWRTVQIVVHNSAAITGASNGFIETNPINDLKTEFRMKKPIHG